MGNLEELKTQIMDLSFEAREILKKWLYEQQKTRFVKFPIGAKAYVSYWDGDTKAHGVIVRHTKKRVVLRFEGSDYWRREQGYLPKYVHLEKE